MKELLLATIFFIIIPKQIYGIVGKNCQYGKNETVNNLCFDSDYSIWEPPNPPIIHFLFYEVEIIGIDILKQIITTNMEYRIGWVENRIEFAETFKGTTMIVSKEMDKFWIPNLRVSNLVNAVYHSYLGRGGSNEFWVGKSNQSKMFVGIFSVMKVETWCDMAFEKFPFDHQECFVKVSKTITHFLRYNLLHCILFTS